MGELTEDCHKSAFQAGMLPAVWAGLAAGRGGPRCAGKLGNHERAVLGQFMLRSGGYRDRARLIRLPAVVKDLSGQTSPGRRPSIRSVMSSTPSQGAPASPIHITARTTVLKGRKFDFEQFTFTNAKGKSLTREVVRHPGAVLVIAAFGDGRTVLIRNHRPTVDRELLECCAGTIEHGDAPDATAYRELIEETGYKAGTLTKLGTFFTSPGLSDELMHAYVASDLIHVGQQLEEDENIKVEIVRTDEALAMASDGRMVDAKSMLGLMWARAKALI